MNLGNLLKLCAKENSYRIEINLIKFGSMIDFLGRYFTNTNQAFNTYEIGFKCFLIIEIYLISKKIFVRHITKHTYVRTALSLPPMSSLVETFVT